MLITLLPPVRDKRATAHFSRHVDIGIFLS